MRKASGPVIALMGETDAISRDTLAALSSVDHTLAVELNYVHAKKNKDQNSFVIPTGSKKKVLCAVRHTNHIRNACYARRDRVVSESSPRRTFEPIDTPELPPSPLRTATPVIRLLIPCYS